MILSNVKCVDASELFVFSHYITVAQDQFYVYVARGWQDVKAL